MDSSDSLNMILTMVFLVILSGLFSATETAYNSVSKTRLKAMDNKKADRVLKLLEDYDELLSSILVGNNIVNIALASVGTVFFVTHLGDIGATVSTLVITVVVLIFGEVSPKSIANDIPETIAIAMVPFVTALKFVLKPINMLFAGWKFILDKIFHVKEERHVTSEELLVMVDEAEMDGEVDADESELLRNAVEFGDREAQDILTHRVNLEAVSITASAEELSQTFIRSKFSRILVFGEGIDDIVGVVHLKDFYREHDSKRFSIKKIMTAPHYAPQTVKIDDLLRQMQKAKASVAVISDEYGGTLGIVTIEDIVEELVGEIWDEHDEVLEAFEQIDENLFYVNGNTELDNFCDFFELEEEEEESDCTTVSGWVMQQMGQIPNEQDSFEFANLLITVEKVDARRVEKIKVLVSAKEEENGEEEK